MVAAGPGPDAEDSPAATATMGREGSGTLGGMTGVRQRTSIRLNT